MSSIGVIASASDKASLNILEKVRALDKDIPFLILEKGLLEADGIDKSMEAEVLVFLSRHESSAKLPALLAHAPGNWSTALMGGKDQCLCPTSSLMLRQIILSLRELAKGKYDVLQECTHHGPYIEKPCLFVEIGSTEAEWTDKTAGMLIAQAILNTRDEYSPKNVPKAVGLGGPHYAQKFNRLLDEVAFGHICPKHMLPFLDEKMLKQAMEKSGADMAYLDWKGLGGEKQRILSLLEEMGIEYKR